MTIDELTIGQVKELATQMLPLLERNRQQPTITHGLKIVVLDRGFVYIGNVYTDGEWVQIENARNIRRWGTTAGLGELALNGPTSDTILDIVGSVQAPFHALQHLIEVKAEKWANKF